MHEGHVGVAIFFVLSGFLITIRYMDHIQGTMAWATRYVWGRFSRIYPMYFLLTAVTFFAIWREPALDITGQWPSYVTSDKILIPLLNFTFLRGFSERFVFTGVAQGWTLTVEETFYLTAPFLLFAAKKRFWPLLVYAFLFLSIGIGLALVFSKIQFFGFFGSLTFVLDQTFFGCSVSFLFGMALAFWVKRYSIQQTSNSLMTWLGCLGIIVCMCVYAYFESPDEGNILTRHPLNSTTGGLLLPLSVVFLLYGLMYEFTFFRRVLSSRVSQQLGKSSYSFYLIHMGVLQVWLSRYVSGNVWVLFGLLVLLSLILHYIIEEPLHKRLIRIVRRTPNP